MLGYLQGRVVAPLRENYTLLIICATTMVVILGQGIISPVLPLFAKSFGVSVALVGTTISGFGLARLLVDLPAAYFSERFGRRMLVVGGPAVTAIASLFSGLALDFWQLLAFRFLAGAGSAMYMTGAIIYLADITDETNRGRLMSLYQGSLLLGVSLGPAVGGIVAGLFGFRAPFYLVSGLAAAGAIWSFLRMPETGPSTSSQPGGRALQPAQETPSGAPVASDDRRRGLGALLLRLDLWLVGLLTLSLFFTRTGARLTILPLVGDERLGLEEWALGLIFSLMAVLNLVTLAPSGVMADRFGRKMVIVPATMVTAVALLLFAVSNSVWLFVLAAVIQGLGAGLAGPAPAAYAADIAPPDMRGMSMGMYRMFGDVGFVVGPMLLGWLADVSSFGWALGASAMFLLGSAGLFGLLARETVRRKPLLLQPDEM
ncbi:MAG: MFS transporter [Dehalococcoidia bacterium]